MKTSLLLLTLIIACAYNNVIAQTSVVSDITYKATATLGVYEITLVMYRDCKDIALCGGTCTTPCTQSLTIRGADSGYTSSNYGSFTLTLQNVRDVKSNIQNCASAKNSCTNRGCVTPGTFSVGYERYEFKGFANVGPTSGIPAGCCKVRFVYELCCRYAIQTLATVSSNIYMDATLNRCLAASISNSSPIFTMDPLYVACGGENITYNNGIVDPDGDSLSISFAPVLTAFNTPEIYASPFAYNHPMPWSGGVDADYPGGIHCDYRTGDVTFTPGNSGLSNFNGIVAFKCDEWRKIGGVYQLLGTVRRECPMTILANCAPNNVPRLLTNPSSSSNPYAPKTYFETIAGRQLCFTVTAKDTDVVPPTLSDTTILSWNQSLVPYGATFLPAYSGNRGLSGPREDVYQFCWTPADSVASSIPYLFMVNAADNRCPLNGKLNQNFSIKVLPDPKLSLSQKNVVCNKVTLKYDQANTQPSGITTRWEIASDTNDISFGINTNRYQASSSSSITHFFSKPGKYFIRVVAQGTSGYSTPVLFDSVMIRPFDVKDSLSVSMASCFGSGDGRITSFVKNGTTPYLYKFHTDSVFRSNSSFPGLVAGNYVLLVKDAAGCVVTDTIAIIQPSPIQSALSFTANPCDTFGTLKGNVSGGTGKYSYRLNEKIVSQISSLPLSASGKYGLEINDSNNCIHKDSITITLPTRLQHTLRFIKNACDSFGTLNIQPLGGSPPYKFRIDEISFQNQSSFTLHHGGMYHTEIKDSANCSILDSIRINLPEVFTYSFIKKEISCFKDMDGSMLLSARGGNSNHSYRYAMMNSSQQNTTGMFDNIASGTYTFTIQDDSNCTLTHTEHWNNPPQLPLGSIMGDSLVALKMSYSYSVVAQPNMTYLWKVQKGTIIGSVQNEFVNVRWDTLGIGTIALHAENSNHCVAQTVKQVTIGSVGVNELKDDLGITIYPNPARNILSVSLKFIPENNHLSLYDLQGKVWLQQELRLSQDLNLETLSPGMYMLNIGDWHGKIVKQE